MVTKHLCWGYSFMLRLRQIAYCLHIRVIDCHTPVYLVHPVYPVYPCIPSIPMYMYMYRPSGYYKVRIEDLYLALRNVIKLYYASLKSRFSKVQSCLNICLNSNVTIIIRGSLSFMFQSSEQRMNAHTRLWKTMCLLTLIGSVNLNPFSSASF